MTVPYGKLIPDILKFPIKPIVTSRFRFLTDIIETTEGIEERRPNFFEHQNNLTIETLTYPDCRKSDLDAFKTFYATKAKGNLNAFRFKNPVDYKATRSPVQHGEHSSSHCLVFPDTFVNGEWRRRLLKKYTYGNVSGYKTLLYPDISTVKIYLNGSLTTNWTFHNGGYFILPGTGQNAVIEAECEFYRRYKFAKENINIQRPDVSRYILSPFTLIEDIQTNATPMLDSDFRHNSAPFQLGFLPSYTEILRFEAFEKVSKNGRITTEQRFLESKDTLDIDGTILRSQEKDNLLCMFIALKGRLLTMPDGNNLAIVRFNTDELEISLEVDGDEC